MSYFSDVYMSFILACDGFNIKNKGLTMNWDDDPKHKSDPIKTSFPILFLSNSADPVVSVFELTSSSRLPPDNITAITNQAASIYG